MSKSKQKDDGKQRKLESFFVSGTRDKVSVQVGTSDQVETSEKKSIAEVETSMQTVQVDDEPLAKKPRLTGCEETESSKKKPVLSPEEVRKITHSLFEGNIHQHDICEAAGCCDVSKLEDSRVKGLSYKFQHNWLNKKSSFCEKTGIWWLVYVEGEGLYCTLCRKHNTYNPQNKSKTFNEEASTRFRPEAIKDHLITRQHGFAISAELDQRDSFFQKVILKREEVEEDVLVKAFTSLYWLTKEEIANRKITSLLKLLEDLGLNEIRHFQHRSEGSLREMFITLGDVMEEHLLSSLKAADHFGLMVDEASDISVYEQMISFVQFYDQCAGETKTAFLSVDNILEENSSANSATITESILRMLEGFELDAKKLTSFVSDGASVMTGKNTGVAKRLKDSVNKELLNIHCICHRLALACTDTLQDIGYIKQVQLFLVQLWSLFENSPKKLAVYLKTQVGLKGVQLTTEQSQQKASRRLKKACQTRWLSFNSSIQAIAKEYLAVLQTLNALKESDAAALGLFKKVKDVKFISTVYILAEILPHLDALSKTFQQGTVDFSQIGPSIGITVEKLDEVVESMSPVTRLTSDLAPDGKFSICDIEATENQIQMMKNLLVKYVDALKTNLDRRFEETLPVLTSFSVFDLLKVPNKKHPGFRQYGLRQISVMAEHFTMNSEEEDRQGIIDEIKAEWGKVKYDMLSWKEDFADYQSSKQASTSTKSQKESTSLITSTEWSLQRICQLRRFYPRLSTIADIILSTPVSNAWPERGASALKRIKTRLRSSIKNDMLQTLLQISINGPVAGSEEAKGIIHKSVTNWLNEKSRRKLPKKAKSKTVTVNTQNDLIMTSDASVQTEGVISVVPLTRYEMADLIRDEVRVFSKALDLPCADDSDQEDDDYFD